GVGVAVGQQPGQAATPRHAVAAGVVNDDQVHAAALGKLGRDAGAGPGADNRPPFGHLAAQTVKCFVSSNKWHRYTSRCSTFKNANNCSATASANSGSLTLLSNSWMMLSALACALMASNSASSASGHQNSLPGASSIETPFRGRK